MDDFHPPNLGFAGQFDFQELRAAADVPAVVEDRHPETVIASAVKVFVFADGDVMISLAVIGDGTLQVRNSVGKKREDAKTFNRSRKLVDERVTGIAGGAVRVFLRPAAIARGDSDLTLLGVDF